MPQKWTKHDFAKKLKKKFRTVTSLYGEGMGKYYLRNAENGKTRNGLIHRCLPRVLTISLQGLYGPPLITPNHSIWKLLKQKKVISLRMMDCIGLIHPSIK